LPGSRSSLERSETERAPRIGFCARLASARRPACGDFFIVEKRDPQKKNFGGARYGWKMMGGKLVDLLARIT
jgi:hypothetical protein